MEKRIGQKDSAIDRFREPRRRNKFEKIKAEHNYVRGSGRTFNYNGSKHSGNLQKLECNLAAVYKLGYLFPVWQCRAIV